MWLQPLPSFYLCVQKAYETVCKKDILWQSKDEKMEFSLEIVAQSILQTITI